MVRKIRRVFFATMLLICCVATSVHGANYETYSNGNLSSTYVTYFKDIISGQSIMNDYVAFRSGQYTYTMAVGNLNYGGDFSGNGKVKVYTFDTESSNYNQNLTYTVTTDSSFYLEPSVSVIYSNLGDYPQLIERGANIETINTILLCVALLSVVIGRVFRKC